MAGDMSKRIKSALGTRFCMHSQCGKQFQMLPATKGMYCSVACKKAGDKEKGMLRRVYLKCLVCGKEFYRSPSRHRGLFCSMKCFGLSKTLPAILCSDCGAEV